MRRGAQEQRRNHRREAGRLPLLAIRWIPRRRQAPDEPGNRVPGGLDSLTTWRQPITEPSREAKPGRAIREVAIPMFRPDLCGMSEAPLAVSIAGQVRGRIDAKLPAHRGEYRRWHGRRIIEERPHEAHRGELQSESETVGIAALLDDLRVIAVIEVEVPGQLLGLTGRPGTGRSCRAAPGSGSSRASRPPDVAELHKRWFAHGGAIGRKPHVYRVQNSIALPGTYAIPLRNHAHRLRARLHWRANYRRSGRRAQNLRL